MKYKKWWAFSLLYSLVSMVQISPFWKKCLNSEDRLLRGQDFQTIWGRNKFPTWWTSQGCWLRKLQKTRPREGTTVCASPLLRGGSILQGHAAWRVDLRNHPRHKKEMWSKGPYFCFIWDLQHKILSPLLRQHKSDQVWGQCTSRRTRNCSGLAASPSVE